MILNIVKCFILLVSISSCFPINDSLHNVRKYHNDDEGEMCSDQFENRIVYCKGRILEAVHYHQIYKCSKDFVDSPLRSDPKEIVEKFDRKFPIHDVTKISRKQLIKFLGENFEESGSELIECEPSDWKDSPRELLRIQDPKLQKFAFELNGIWKILCRKVAPTVKKHPNRHSILWLDEQFIIPGGFYREVYYWDTYWIIKGLLKSEMLKTAKAMVRNLASLVDRLGFVPNGSRVYYTRRTQPPLLTPMVFEIYEHTNDIEFMKKLLPTLVKEFEFWERERKFPIEFDGKNYLMYLYNAPTNVPRPENFRIDTLRSRHMNETEKRKFLKAVASAAESGWDFSSRWMRDGHSIQTMDTQHIAPADLNAFQCMNMRILAYLHEIVGQFEDAKKWSKKYEHFLQDFTKLFYDKQKGSWYDFDIDEGRRIEVDFASAVIPLFAECYDKEDENVTMRFYERLLKAGFFNFKGGIPATLTPNATQQWDYPLGWSPLNHMLVEALRKTNNRFLQERAFELAQKWIGNNFRVYNETGLMFEKYNVLGSIPDVFDVQLGFGWSNGAALDLLSTYYDRLKAPND